MLARLAKPPAKAVLSAMIMTEAATAKSPPAHAFTTANARAMAAKSLEARKRNSALRQVTAPPAPTPEAQPTAQPDSRAREKAEEVELVNEQIARTRAVLNDDDYDYCSHCKRSGVQPQHRAQLNKSLDAFLDRRRILRGEPGPGTFRPSAEGQRSRAGTLLARSEPAPAPAPEVERPEQE